MVQRQHLNLILGKYSLSDGALLWIRRDLRGALGTSKTGHRDLKGAGVAIANDDNLFVGGYLSGSLAYNAGNPGTGSQFDMLLLKIDSSNGDVLWSKQHGVGAGASSYVDDPVDARRARPQSGSSDGNKGAGRTRRGDTLSMSPASE